MVNGVSILRHLVTIVFRREGEGEQGWQEETTGISS